MMLPPKVGVHSRRRRSSRLFSVVRSLTRLRPSSLRSLSWRSLSLRSLSLRKLSLRSLSLRSVWAALSLGSWRRRGSSSAGLADRRRVRSRRTEQSPLERRRAQALLLAAVVFAFVVVFLTMPWSVLASQHQQLSSDAAQVKELKAENQALDAQARLLTDPAAAAGLARQDYGLVRLGQRAYDILPSAGSASTAAGAGHVPLDEAPVVPGSRRSQELLGADVGSVTASGTPARASGSRARGERSVPAGAGQQNAPQGTGGFWSRVAHTLEFWT